MGLRQERLADEIRDILAQCFQGGRLSDPRVQAVTVTAVTVTADLQIATLYFRVYQGHDAAEAKAGLESASGYLRKQLANGLDVRRVPELKFFFDESIEHASNIEGLLQKLREDGGQ